MAAISDKAAVAGTTLVLSKTAAATLATATTSVLNQATDAQDQGEPLNISPIKIITDIATDITKPSEPEKLAPISLICPSLLLRQMLLHIK
jgi:hypothetical protein